MFLNSLEHICTTSTKISDHAGARTRYIWASSHSCLWRKLVQCFGALQKRSLRRHFGSLHTHTYIHCMLTYTYITCKQYSIHILLYISIGLNVFRTIAESHWKRNFSEDMHINLHYKSLVCFRRMGVVIENTLVFIFKKVILLTLL